MGLSFRERQPVKSNSWNAGQEVGLSCPYVHEHTLPPTLRTCHSQEDVDMQSYGQGDAATQQFDRTVEALTGTLGSLQTCITCCAAVQHIV